MQGNKESSIGSGRTPPPREGETGPGKARRTRPSDRDKPARARRDPGEPEVDAWHRGQPPE